jgi:hypothetical protein
VPHCSPSSKREAIHNGPRRHGSAHEATTTTTATVTSGERYGDQELGRCRRGSFPTATTAHRHGVQGVDDVHAAAGVVHDLPGWLLALLVFFLPVLAEKSVS